MHSNSKQKVFIENIDANYQSMFTNRGFVVVDSPKDADIIQFTGGADVSPSMYGRLIHPHTHTNPRRDDFCVHLYRYAQKEGKPCVGICRGAQFLHVMNGGEMVQDCDNHAIHGTHSAKVTWMPNTEIQVSSTHHQMMGSPDVGEVLMYTDRSTYKQTMGNDGQIEDMATGYDIEAMVYHNSNSLSYQPHPEFYIRDERYKECEEAYFFMMFNYLKGIV